MSNTKTPDQVDVRGPRFAAWITTAVLVVTLLISGINPLAAPRARDIGNALLFLSSSLAERITGQTLIVDGGATIRSQWGMTPDLIAQFRASY